MSRFIQRQDKTSNFRD